MSAGGVVDQQVPGTCHEGRDEMILASTRQVHIEAEEFLSPTLNNTNIE